MDAASPKPNRRIVKDFTRRNFVIFYLVLLLVPSVYLLWYYTSAIWGGMQVQDSLHVGTPGTTLHSQASFFWHLLMAGWRAVLGMLPCSIGQYLLGLECAFNQQFLWSSGALVAGALLSMVLWVDLTVNPELHSSQRILWTVMFCAGSVFGVLVPQFCYWFFYMWLEPDKRSESGSAIMPDALSA